MKRIFLISVTLSALVFACNNKNNGNGDDDASVERKTFKANTSINAGNACNNIFLDSTKLEAFISNDSIGGNLANQMRAFYYDRNFEYAWFAPDGLTEQGREFWNLYTYSVSSLKDSSFFLKALNKRMPNITTQDSLEVSANDKSYLQAELMLSQAFLKFMEKDGKEVAVEDYQKYVPAKKEDVMASAKNMLADEDGVQNDDAKHAFEALRNELKKYYDLANKGGWPTVPTVHSKLKMGGSNAAIPAIKKRLQLTGELQGDDTSATFDANLDAAVKSFQVSMGYTPDGIVTDTLISYMNIPAQKRVEQILVNLNRMRWMPQYITGRMIIANIPEYELHVYENKQKAFDMDVVVGKEGAGTVIFTGNLTEIVFSPYWNIPPSIVKKEIVPKMNADAGYMDRENLEITGESGGLPVVRQRPGPKNSLGRVKFLFHNSYNIYFHDTPAKDLFNKDKRAYSHGCIRLADPVKMANYLLEDSQNWTPEKIEEAMNQDKEKYVTLKNVVPVVITYYTAWVDETGRVNLRDDIYGHDEAAAAKMFTNP